MPSLPSSLLSPFIALNSRKSFLISNFISCLYLGQVGSGEKRSWCPDSSSQVLAKRSLLSLNRNMSFTFFLALLSQLLNCMVLVSDPLQLLHILCKLWALNNNTGKWNGTKVLWDVAISWLTEFMTLFLTGMAQNKPAELLRCQDMQQNPR